MKFESCHRRRSHCVTRVSNPCRRLARVGNPCYALCFFFLSSASSMAAEKITFADHVRPIFNTNCVSCHNPDKAKAGLDLTSFSSVMAGSSSAKVIEPGDPASSLLYMLVTHQAEPHMPLKGNKLPDEQL